MNVDAHPSPAELLMQHSPTDLKSEELERDARAWKITSTANWEAQHAKMAEFVKLKVSLASTTVITGEAQHAVEMRELIRSGDLISIKYLHTIKSFVVEGPTPLVHFLAYAASHVEVASADNKYTLMVDENANLEEIGAKTKTESTMAWINIYLAPGTKTPIS